MAPPSSNDAYCLAWSFEESLLGVSEQTQTSSTFSRGKSLCEVNDRVPPSQTSTWPGITSSQETQSSFRPWLNEPPQSFLERRLAGQSWSPFQRWLAELPRSLAERPRSLAAHWLEEASRLSPEELTEVNSWICMKPNELDMPPTDVPALPRNPNSLLPDMRNDSHTFGSKVKRLVALELPQGVLFGGGVLWIFAGMTLPQFLAKASVYGIDIEQLPPGDGVDGTSRTRGSRLGQSSHVSRADRGRIGKQKSSRVKFPNQKAQATLRVDERRSSRDDEDRFGCPFSKRNPLRYLNVRGRNRNPCTDPPGLEYGHIR